MGRVYPILRVDPLGSSAKTVNEISGASLESGSNMALRSLEASLPEVTGKVLVKATVRGAEEDRDTDTAGDRCGRRSRNSYSTKTWEKGGVGGGGAREEIRNGVEGRETSG